MFEKLMTVIRKWHDQRLAIDALEQLSDAQLLDIGLTRGNLRDSVYGRFHG